MPAAEEHLLDYVHVASIEFHMYAELEIASATCSPVGGAYHGLTPSEHCLRMLDSIQEAWD
jgi:hypothetical protein